jgi:hypothetical protein
MSKELSQMAKLVVKSSANLANILVSRSKFTLKSLKTRKEEIFL